MIQIQRLRMPDTIGAATSGLCALHCMATPFIFLAKAGSVYVPEWYHMIDYVFIVISFGAIYLTLKTTVKNWMKIALWSTWSVLLLAILNETFEVKHLPEASVYVPALIIAVLHIYNQKYCKCKDDCCTTD